MRGSCSAFDVSTRKVPPLALVPRGHLNHAIRAKKKVAGSIQHAKHQNNASEWPRDETDDTSSSPPHPARRESIGDTLGDPDEQSEPSQGSGEINEEQEEDEDHHDVQSELRLGERFLNMMALMARLSTQSLGDNAPSSAGPNRLTERSLPFYTDRTLLRTPQRVLSAAATAFPPQQQQSLVNSPPTSPIHAVRKVAKRLPHALQGPLTFDICMLLPTPLDERQSPLRSPIRRKRLRKRVRRRRLRRRARRTWQASHASWPPHASADYIVDHSRQDIAGINAARLVGRLDERKVNVPSLPRVISMPLPPLQRNDTRVLATNRTEAVDEKDQEAADGSEDDEQESDNSESDVDAEGEELGDSQDEDESNKTLLCSGNTAATAAFEDREKVAEKTPAQARRRPLYHQPAWISPELHTWLVASGLFATKPRRELLSTGL
ncbi:hypothetical protein PC129_g6127 [Phytophthora cactorum]|uniref:Uncharacterized protein n=1 Tax=Phytophthora cactorum TaxID=29920 RepID=A0A8T1CKY1_9STRA|nr:hypothetical protein Pcac1_g22384 [Phytophthora cactorum]KAG2826780.1 hypothetical protein PC111_g8831 [Phytophthora cactorum]KAG2827691.1 hypothetical protein PC112_g8763 [Phytophthora cactorum]KAG2857887.1 hypothetical protein PC113_g10280 [Phytophthora cactorum]KAG2907222.1 hypothetical protein PC114_g10876 [Phytophthora cactorum]